MKRSAAKNSRGGPAFDWVSPPGETILDIVESHGLGIPTLKKKLGYRAKRIDGLISGKLPITNKVAHRLASVLGGNARFWMAREAKYRERCANG